MAEDPRILFTGGGTGGHLYPGLAVAREIEDLAGGAKIAFYVTRRAIDRRLMEQHAYAARFEDARGLSLRPWHWPGWIVRLLSNMRRARRYLAEYRPDAVIGLGGFGSYAAVREAQKMGLPTFILNPDLVVGRANARLAAQATAVFCQFDETTRGLRSQGRVEVIGCPVRRELFGVDRRASCSLLGLDAERKTLVVTGASSGARNINQAVVRLAGRLRHLPGWQTLHLTGRDLYGEVQHALGPGHPEYQIRDYIDEMGLVYAVADLVISRAGAGTVAELTAVGRPAVLVPYPYHRDRHQERHARLLEDRGAAVRVGDQADPDRNAEALWQVLPVLMEDSSRRAAMAEAARSMGRPKAARSAATAVVAAVGRTGGRTREPRSA